jgi:predicted dehydrogenase
MAKVNYALIGFGGIAQNRIVPEGFGLGSSKLNAHPYAALKGINSRNSEKEKTAKELGVKWYKTAEEVLEDPEIDAVYISTNNLTHSPLAMKCLDAGKHCLLEKPIACSLKDALKLQKKAKEKKLSLGIDHMMKYNVYNKETAKIVKNKTIGEINDLVLHIEFSYGSTKEEAQSWRCSNPKEVGGPIGDVASHCMYMAEFLTGKQIQALQAVYLPKTMGIKAEEGALIYCKFSSELQATVRVAFNQLRGGLETTFNNLGFEIYGSKGVIRSYGTLFQLSGHQDEPIKIRTEIDDTNGNITSIAPNEIKNIYQEMITDHALSIFNNQPLDGSEAIHNLALILAAHKSAEQKSFEIKVNQ